MKDRNPRIVCADGFSISVQASEFCYSTPRSDNGPYTHVECGFPSSKPETAELRQYSEALYGCDDESQCDFTETVYGYVPVETVLAEIEKHGGIVKGKMPKIWRNWNV